ncbi:MAG: hypothetical protein A2504_07780 [Bdellovibrionales bacterium RIFOXYD12_FULL_39_22]|nr:MAG: hypothetical protein A2385_11105 [Bdellovibrionales bacterium RIFOXYB1_FULL_39_21]OFZ41310.1 MAG: hypothetical protein A2485_00580 [Bdellovibrionales bacterium RIFOXYC12_FULL_39_17]OFZ45104.1 MAG: hypothetical protein A2404_11400 [Bdellovibrionales bacterium RIFOXYC1_FULL_39_130]OFZ74488.1 MAG: hypothetical protein A2560_11435 [Bdellovibrionales bacterium RIFOXYD1_FULL_39_84]OFZ92500.1 MAG: hypothetical protein A2504_07780 [Bdellovibrionales bacterium RIFOXYD12_FULL_39_22]
MAINREERAFQIPTDNNGKRKKIPQYFGENVFDFRKSDDISPAVRAALNEVVETGRPLTKEIAEEVARAVTKWATDNGATHYCHWFHPLTGGTAEKHDSFLSFSKHGVAIEKLGVDQLIQGEPDASSFPNGGARSTFEARGYTSWDISSPMFLIDGINGKTLYIPTAFVSFNGEALDIKIPLLRSIGKMDSVVTKFMNLVGHKEISKIIVTCGAEQEYFLVDREIYFKRPDLIMTGRTLQGKLSTKNQQLSDHYFGTIPNRVLAFMQELDFELHKLGFPAKTRHNEVAPGQFEIAPIFSEANLASDHNQLLMACIKKMALRHGFVALLHEKPFAGINGSGKHINWSLSDNVGRNLLDPGESPHNNYLFLSVMSIIVEAVYRHADLLRASVASHGNDHRLGGHEAPPSIISIYLGEALVRIFESIAAEQNLNPNERKVMDLQTSRLAHFFKDNSDRNRTSPFAFTGNKFEFRAVGSSQPIGLPLTILNAAVVEVFEESNLFIEKRLKEGKNAEEALIELIRKWYKSASAIIFNGDGYTQEWIREAEKRGLPNLRTSIDGIKILKDEARIKFLEKSGILSAGEIRGRYNVYVENLIKHLEIEASTLNTMLLQNIIPAGLEYKKILGKLVKQQKESEISASTERALLVKTAGLVDSIYLQHEKLESTLKEVLAKLSSGEAELCADLMAKEVMPQMKAIALECNKLEEIIPDAMWPLPKYSDLLFYK